MENFFEVLPKNDLLQFLKKFLRSLSYGAYITDSTRKIIFWNKAAEKITGYRASDVLETHCYNNLLQHIDQKGKILCQQSCPLAKTIQNQRSHQAEVFLFSKNGTRIPVSIQTFFIGTKEERIGALEIFVSKVETEEMKLEIKKLSRLAQLDPLTSLPNRRFLENALQIALDELVRFQQPFAIHFIDADRFKMINDQFGHQAGDQALLQIAQTININIRKIDYFGRWGGDEFLLIQKKANRKAMLTLAHKLKRLVSAAKIISFPEINLSISIGSYLINKSQSLNSILKKADFALYQSKAAKL